MSRYERQIRLEEVGRSGQARIQAATARVTGTDGDMVELSYLERAGFRAVELHPEMPAAPFRHEDWFVFETPREVGAGAWRALDKIRHLLWSEKP